jgi:hypothetical protein
MNRKLQFVFWAKSIPFHAWPYYWVCFVHCATKLVLTQNFLSKNTLAFWYPARLHKIFVNFLRIATTELPTLNFLKSSFLKRKQLKNKKLWSSLLYYQNLLKNCIFIFHIVAISQEFFFCYFQTAFGGT